MTASKPLALAAAAVIAALAFAPLEAGAAPVTATKSAPVCKGKTVLKTVTTPKGDVQRCVIDKSKLTPPACPLPKKRVNVKTKDKTGAVKTTSVCRVVKAKPPLVCPKGYAKTLLKAAVAAVPASGGKPAVPAKAAVYTCKIAKKTPA